MFTSRINQNLREDKGYTYGARSRNYATRNFGVWYVTTSVRTDATVASLEEILREVRQVRRERPIQSDELSRARQELLGGYAESLELSLDLVSEVADLFTQQLSPAYLAQLPPLLEQLSLEQVQVESERLAPAHLSAVVVGDAQVIEAPLRAICNELVAAPSSMLD